MSIDKLLVTTIGAGLIIFIWWFFFGKKETQVMDKEVKKDKTKKASIDIIVDGGYKPATIFIDRGVKTTLKITRKDPNTCLSDIILPDFKISKYLPLNKTVEIELQPENAGEYPFQCGMNMFHGKVVVD